jgi:hypothetical protein
MNAPVCEGQRKAIHPVQPINPRQSHSPFSVASITIFLNLLSCTQCTDPPSSCDPLGPAPVSLPNTVSRLFRLLVLGVSIGCYATGVVTKWSGKRDARLLSLVSRFLGCVRVSYLERMKKQMQTMEMQGEKSSPKDRRARSV